MQGCCLICLETKDDHLIKRSKCTCSFCYDCLIEWIKEEMKLTRIKHFTGLRCPIEGCKVKFTFEELKEICSKPKNKKYEKAFQEILLNFYLKETQDIRPCPNKNCNNYGILPKRNCLNKFKCDKCDYEWYDKEFQRNTKSSLSQLKETKNDFLNFVFEFLLTKACSKCSITIYKNGGCSHMTCKKCNNYFCWWCGQSLHQHNNSQCFQNFLFYNLLQSYLIICLLWISGLLMQVLSFIGLVIRYALLWFFPHSLIGAPIGICIVLWQLCTEGRKAYRMKKTASSRQFQGRLYLLRRCTPYLLGALALVIVTGLSQWLLFDIYEKDIWHVIIIVGIDSIIAFSFLLIVFFETQINQKWLRYVF